MNIQDFTFSAKATGYTISYKGHEIGGASIMGIGKSRGKARVNDIKNYIESAKREIEQLAAGGGSKFLRERIQSIDNK